MNVVWRQEWTKAEETPWSVFEKLCYAHWVDRIALIRVLGSVEVKCIKNAAAIGDKHRELFNLKGFDIELLKDMLGINLREHNRSIIESITRPLHYYRMPGSSWFRNQLRWCPDCMDAGFHSWLHQFALIRECPYHGSALLDSCPGCHEPIPFLFSDNRLGDPFMCKCGHCLSDVYNSRWTKWEKSYDIKAPSVISWLSKIMMNADGRERWLFIPEYCDMDLITTKQPILQSKSFSGSVLKINDLRLPDFRSRFYLENRGTFKAIEQYLLRRFLKGHRHCIVQFLELRKEEGKGFNKQCPYAYAFVFWRKSILMLDHFYRRHRVDIEPPSMYGLNTATKLIKTEITFLLEEYTRQTAASGTSENAIFWLLNKVTALFTLNFFFEWLKIAEEGAEKEITPTWKEIEKMKTISFPRCAFKYDISSLNRPLEFFMIAKLESDLPSYACPNSTVSSRKMIRNMESYTPQSVAMKVYDRIENKELQRYVDRYIQRFNF